MSKDLQVRDPESAIEIVENWAEMARDARKRRAANASQNDIRDELRTLLSAYVMLYGRKGTDTSPRTLETYWRGAEKMLDWCAKKGRTPHQLIEEDANRFMVSIGDLSAKTRQVYLTGAKTLIEALRWTGMGSGEPFAGVRVMDPTPRAEKADPYTVEELSKMLSVADEREHVLILLAADAGLRLAEAVSLNWGDIDTERKQITITGKGRKRSTVSVTDRLLEALNELGGQRGRVIKVSRRRVQQLINRVCQRAEIKGRGFHALRHSCGTRLYGATRDLLIVQRHLRHSSSRTTELYAHLAEGDYQKAVAALEMNGLR